MRSQVRILLATAALLPLLVAACSGKSLVPYTTDTPPLVLLPAEKAGITDKRGRFREIACAVLQDHGKELPHYRSCDEALIRLGEEHGATGEPVDLGPSEKKLIAALVPGIGWECFENWLNYENEFEDNVSKYGFSSYIFPVDGMSGTTNNARQIRDTILQHADELQPGQLVLIGYSKGAPDTLEALVTYPEIHPYVGAMISVAGAVGGSPLANAAKESQLNLLKHIPDSTCTQGDGHAIESLRPATRRAWMQANPLPESIPFYSLVTYPEEDRISSVLKSSWKKLGSVDPRNDSQVIFYDQVIPGSTLVGYLNADHWAIAIPVSEKHPFIGRHFVDRNEYPRQAMFEAVLRFIEEDLK
jgi:pimeloyl-ACP methyl ester carboxylesterase